MLYTVLYVVAMCVLYGLPLLALWRFYAVCRAKRQAVQVVYQFAREDKIQNRPWEWRYEELDSLKFEEAVMIFWVRPKSLYANMRCMKRS